jgi:Anthrax toxin LF subunit
MADGRKPGPVGAGGGATAEIDPGTLVRRRAPAPGPIAVNSVATMSMFDRFIEVFKRSLPYMPDDAKEQFKQLLSPTSLEIMAGMFVIWAGSHAVGFGFAGDAFLLGMGIGFLGMQAFAALSHLRLTIELTISAKNEADLELAAQHFAEFVAIAGVGVLLYLIAKGARKAAPKVRQIVTGALADSRLGGIAAAHFQVFQQVAREANRIILVRLTNPKSTPWIEKGFPAKPISIKAHTSKITGIVTAASADEIQAARNAGFYVVDADGVPRDVRGLSMRFPKAPEWPLEQNQVIHPTQRLPLVGDYDLQGVIDPQAPGRNLTLASSNGKWLQDWTNPRTREIGAQINARLDQPRVMHGAADGRFSLPGPGDVNEGAIGFFPDGTTRRFNSPAEIQAYYDSISRQAVGAPKKLPK